MVVAVVRVSAAAHVVRRVNVTTRRAAVDAARGVMVMTRRRAVNRASRRAARRCGAGSRATNDAAGARCGTRATRHGATSRRASGLLGTCRSAATLVSTLAALARRRQHASRLRLGLGLERGERSKRHGQSEEEMGEVPLHHGELRASSELRTRPWTSNVHIYSQFDHFLGDRGGRILRWAAWRALRAAINQSPIA